MPNRIRMDEVGRAVLEIETEGSDPALRIKHQGTGPAVEIIGADGTVLSRIDHAGVPSGAIGGSEVLFDQKLSVAGPTIGPFDIPSGYAAVEALFMGATDYPAIAVTTTAGGIQINGDAGANYYYESLLDAGSVYGGSNNQGAGDTAVARINMPGATAGAGSVCIARCLFYDYDNTDFAKIGILSHTHFDPVTKANGRMRVTAAYWDSTAAINQLAMVMRSNNFVAGSRFTIIGHK